MSYSTIKYSIICILSLVSTHVVSQSQNINAEESISFTPNIYGYNLERLLETVLHSNEIQSKDIDLVERYFFDNKHLFNSLINKGGISHEEYHQIAEIFIKDFLKNEHTLFNHSGHSHGSLLRGEGNNIDILAAGEPCGNMDFETCDFTSWELLKAKKTGSAPYSTTGPTPTGSGSLHHIVDASSGNDPYTGLPKANPYGGSCSVMIGDGLGNGKNVSFLRQTFLVDSGSTSLVYSYMLIMEDPGHSASDQPFFRVRVLDQNGAAIDCGRYETVAGSGNGWIRVSSIDGYYLPWTTAIVPLDDYIGQDVTVEFIIGDCQQGGHAGYGYVEASCQPLDITAKSTVICNGDPITLNGPPGASSYLWSTGETTESIEVSTPGNYTLVIIPTVGGSACQLEMDIDVTANNTDIKADFEAFGCFGDPVTIVDKSTITPGTITSYEWDLDNDGDVDATTPNPTIPASSDQSTEISLWVSDGVCASNMIKTKTLSSITPAITADPVCDGTVTQLLDASNITSPAPIITTYSWDFDQDGVEDANGPSTTNSFTVGQHNVKLIIANDDGCIDSIEQQVVVNPVPVSLFSVSNSCLDVTIQNQSTISSGSISGNSWDMDDQSPLITVESPPMHSYASDGQYTISHIATSDQGCSNTSTQPITLAPPIIASFTVQDVCADTKVEMFDNSTTNGQTVYNYDIESDGQNDYDSPDAEHDYIQPGTYDITLSISNQNGCEDDTTISVTVHPVPATDFQVSNGCVFSDLTFNDQTTLSSGSIATWNWTLGDGSVCISSDTLYPYQSEGIYPVTLVVITDQGCTAIKSKDVEVYPLPQLNFIVDDVCRYNNTVFTNLSSISNTITTNNISTYLWQFGDNSQSSNEHPQNLYDTAGIYEVTLIGTSNNSCVDTLKKNTTVHPRPKIQFSTTDLKGCSPWCIDFTNESTIKTGSIAQHTWLFGNVGSSNDLSPSFCFENTSRANNKSFNLQLTQVSDFGCESDTLIENYIESYPIPLANFAFTPKVEDHENGDIQFEDLSIIPTKWHWTFGDGDSSAIEDPFHLYIDSGTYKVTLAIENEYLCKDTTWQMIRIDPTFDVFAPNAISPNGDGKNDQFYIKGYGIAHQELIILDRWGRIIHTAEGMQPTWNGIHKGQTAQIDVYVYKANILDVFGNTHAVSGKVTVLR